MMRHGDGQRIRQRCCLGVNSQTKLSHPWSIYDYNTHPFRSHVGNKIKITMDCDGEVCQTKLTHSSLQSEHPEAFMVSTNSNLWPTTSVYSIQSATLETLIRTTSPIRAKSLTEIDDTHAHIVTTSGQSCMQGC